MTSTFCSGQEKQFSPWNTGQSLQALLCACCPSELVFGPAERVTSWLRTSSAQQHWVLLVGICSSISSFLIPGRGKHENTHLVFCYKKKWLLSYSIRIEDMAETSLSRVRILLREKKISKIAWFHFSKKREHDILFREEQILATLSTCSICFSLLCGCKGLTSEQAVHQVTHLQWTPPRAWSNRQAEKDLPWVQAISHNMYQHFIPCPASQIWRHMSGLAPVKPKGKKHTHIYSLGLWDHYGAK